MAIRIKTFRIKDDAGEHEINAYLENRSVRHWATSYEDGGWNILVASEEQRMGRDSDRPRNDRHSRSDNGRNGEKSALRKEKTPLKPEPVIDVAPADMPLYEAIRKWRNQRAREENVKPFMLFNNKEIETLVKTKPNTTEQLRTVLGNMTDAHFERYQNELLGFVTGATSLSSVHEPAEAVA